jgi:type I restriction enzyme S subunit
MSTGVLDDLAFPYPPVEEQRRFERIAESIEQQKEVNRAHLAELDTLFASLQSRAFRGEL